MKIAAKTYWNNEGEYQAEYEELARLIPPHDESPNVYIESVRVIGNCYYKLYNDGSVFADQLVALEKTLSLVDDYKATKAFFEIKALLTPFDQSGKCTGCNGLGYEICYNCYSGCDECNYDFAHSCYDCDGSKHVWQHFTNEDIENNGLFEKYETIADAVIFWAYCLFEVRE